MLGHGSGVFGCAWVLRLRWTILSASQHSQDLPAELKWLFFHAPSGSIGARPALEKVLREYKQRTKYRRLVNEGINFEISILIAHLPLAMHAFSILFIVALCAQPLDIDLWDT